MDQVHETTQRFFHAAPQYYSSGDLLRRNETTLSQHAAKEVIRIIATAIKEDLSVNQHASSSIVLDLAGGIGYYTVLLSCELPDLQFILMDQSLPMLNIGRVKIAAGQCVPQKIAVVCANAYAIPMAFQSCGHILLFSAIHLLQNKTLLFRELRRVLAPGGRIWILTFDPEDIRTTIYHSYFPGYYGIDSQRYLKIDKLLNLLADAGFTSKNIVKVQYEIVYPNVSDIVELASSKPFSTFSYYSDSEFANCLYEFRDQLIKVFGNGEVINKSVMTLIELNASA